MNHRRLAHYAAFVLLGFGGVSSVDGAPERPRFSIPPEGEVQPTVAALAPPQLGEPATVDVLRAKSAELTRCYDALDYDPWLRAGELGPGVEPAFRWVRDNVRFESYPGAFRGAKGAYMSRAANGADRSLLLADLLKAKGFKTRFVSGRLAAERAEALFERIFAPNAGAANGTNAAATESPQRTDLMQRIAARARRDYGVLRAALGEGMPTAASPTREIMLDEIASHVWLQAETAGGKWVDLDTAFADAEPGQSFCDGGTPLDTLPSELQQRVTIRVIAERLIDGKLESDVVLEVTKPVAELIGQQAALFHVPANQGGGGLAGFGISVMAGGGKAADPSTKVPTLALSTETISAKPVRFDDGNVPPAPSGGGGFVDLGGGGGDAAPVAGGPQLVAEFIEFELTFPGGAKETTRRTLVDRGGAAWRAGATHDVKALRPFRRDAHGLIEPSTIHNIWFSGGRHDMAAYAKRVKRVVHAVSAIETGPPGAAASAPAPARAPDPPRGGGQLDLTAALLLIGMQNFPVVMIGDHDFLPALNDDPSAARFYLDSPRILMFSLSVDRGDGTSASPGTVETQIDLRRDKVRGVARNAEAMAAVARRKLWFGVLGGALEHEVTANQSSVMTEGAAVPVASTSALIDRGEPAVVALRPGEAGAAALKQIPCGPDAALRLSGALAHGEALVVPRDAFSNDNGGSNAGGNEGGFWAVSLATGDTRAVWGDDLHASRSRSPLPNPQTRRTKTYIINDDLSSREEGGIEAQLVTNTVAIGTITATEYLIVAGQAIVEVVILAMMYG